MIAKERNRIIASYEDEINNHPALEMAKNRNNYSNDEYTKASLKLVEIVWKYEVFVSEKYVEYSDILVKVVLDCLNYVVEKNKEKEIELIEGTQEKLFTHLVNKSLKWAMYGEKQKETPGGVVGVTLYEHRKYVRLLKNVSKLFPDKSYDERVEIVAKSNEVTADFVKEVLRNGPITIGAEIKTKDGDTIDIIDNIGKNDRYFENLDDSEEKMEFFENMYATLDSRKNKDVIKGMLTMYTAKELKRMHLNYIAPNMIIEKEIIGEMLTKRIEYDLIVRESGIKLDYCFIDKDFLCQLLIEYVLEEALNYCLRQEPSFLQPSVSSDGKQSYCCPMCRKGKNGKGLIKLSDAKLHPRYVCETCKASGKDSYDVLELYAKAQKIELKKGSKYKSFRVNDKESNVFDSLCKYYGLIYDNAQRIVLSNGINKGDEKIGDTEELIDASLYNSKGIAAYYNVKESSLSRTWKGFKQTLAKKLDIEIREKRKQEDIRGR